MSPTSGPHPRRSANTRGTQRSSACGRPWSRRASLPPGPSPPGNGNLQPRRPHGCATCRSRLGDPKAHFDGAPFAHHHFRPGRPSLTVVEEHRATSAPCTNAPRAGQFRRPFKHEVVEWARGSAYPPQALHVFLGERNADAAALWAGRGCPSRGNAVWLRAVASRRARPRGTAIFRRRHHRRPCRGRAPSR